ncbi:sensor histidine kinase [Paenibacillus lentus]|nr:sensor histidine kinase [Paenibacillus lentus]
MMLQKWYPADQIEKYFLIDVFAVMILIYQVFIAHGTVNLVLKLVLTLLLLTAHYVGLWWRDWRLLAASLLGMLMLAALSTYVVSGILMYGFIFADFLGRANKKATMITGMAGIVAMFILYGWLDQGNPFAIFSTFYFPIMVAQLAAPIVVYTRERANILKEKLDIANAQLERYIQEEERNRIARDLHDTLGQTLTMIKLKSELTLRLVEKNPEKAKHELHDILHTSRYALKQVRELVTDMKFVSLEKEMQLSRDILQKAGIEFIVKDDGAMIPLSNAAETVAALTVREAITNVIKHSEASQCTITLHTEPEYYCIQVSDNGNGNLREGEGNGLQSMRERMDMMQGDMHITASPGSGTKITFRVPMTNRQEVAAR